MSFEYETYDCPKCGSVTMRVEIVEHQSNQTGALDLRFVSSVTEYGDCIIAKEMGGVMPGDRMKDCPVMCSISENKNRL